MNIRIPEKEESHTFFLVGHRFQGVADQEPHPSAPHAQQPWGWVAKHHMGVPRGYPSWCDVHLLPWYTGSPLGVTKPPLWPFGERERKKERNIQIRKKHPPGLLEPLRDMSPVQVAGGAFLFRT